MAIKYNNNNVTSIKYNGNDVNIVYKDDEIVWCKPYTLTIINPTYGTVSRTITSEPTASIGGLTNNSTIYYGDKMTVTPNTDNWYYHASTYTTSPSNWTSSTLTTSNRTVSFSRTTRNTALSIQLNTTQLPNSYTFSVTNPSGNSTQILQFYYTYNSHQTAETWSQIPGTITLNPGGTYPYTGNIPMMNDYSQIKVVARSSGTDYSATFLSDWVYKYQNDNPSSSSGGSSGSGSGGSSGGNFPPNPGGDINIKD